MKQTNYDYLLRGASPLESLSFENFKKQYYQNTKKQPPENVIRQSVINQEIRRYEDRYHNYPETLFLHQSQVDFFHFVGTVISSLDVGIAASSEMAREYKINPLRQFSRVEGIEDLPLVRTRKYPVLKTLKIRSLNEILSSFDEPPQYGYVIIRPASFPKEGIVLGKDGETLLLALARTGGNDGLQGLGYLESQDENTALEIFKGLDQDVLSLHMLGFPEIGKKVLEFQTARGLQKLRLARELKGVLNG